MKQAIKRVWAAFMKIHLVDRCLILIMAVLLLQTGYSLFFSKDGADASSIDVVVRTASATIFGYFLSANFINRGKSGGSQPGAVQATASPTEAAGATGPLLYPQPAAATGTTGETPQAKLGFAIPDAPVGIPGSGALSQPSLGQSATQPMPPTGPSGPSAAGAGAFALSTGAASATGPEGSTGGVPTVQFPSSATSPSQGEVPTITAVASDATPCNRVQVRIATGIGLFCLLTLILVRDVLVPLNVMDVSNAAMGAISQLRDFTLSCVGFLVGMPTVGEEK